MNAIEHAHGVVVIGTGAAGMNAAIAASATCEVILLTDRSVGRSNSVVAQGGLQRPYDTAASRRAMVADIARSARGPIDADRVVQIVEGSAAAIDQLRSWGAPFDLRQTGEFERHLAGGLSEDRVVSAGDHVGAVISKTLRHRISGVEQIQVRSWSSVVRIRPDGRDAWIAAVEPREGSPYELRTPALVVATGGASFSEARERGLLTTNPVNRNGQMVEILRALSIPAIEPKVFQFHPFGLVDHARNGIVRCVPERITQLGVSLVDQDGEPLVEIGADRHAILEAFHGAARDGRLAERGGVPFATLEMSRLRWQAVEEEFPAFARWASHAGVDGTDLAIGPAIHYQLGGFAVDREGATELPGLYLAGEVTGGIHGANRLMGMGLTQSLVDGWVAGTHAARWIATGR